MSYIPRTNLNFMSMKNKQYKIDKGLMLFTQPRSPFFYGKIRLNRKYVTKSFAPITDLDEAKAMLFDWQKELLSKNTISVSTVSSSDNFKSRSEYVEHVPIENDFQFLDSQNVTIELKFKTNDNLGNIITNRSLNTNQPPWYALSLGSSINNYQQVIRYDWVNQDSQNSYFYQSPEVHNNHWHHVAVVKDYDLGLIRFFFNGELVAEDEYNNSNYLIGGSANYLQIGGWAGPGWNGPEGREAEFFNGLIDEVRISDIARYNDDFIPQEMHIDENVIAIYNFDEAFGDIVNDESDNQNHGTINGDVQWVQLESSSLPNWISSNIASSIISPGESVTFEFTADATNMEAGEHSYMLTMNTNDPVSPIVEIPVTFNIGILGCLDESSCTYNPDANIDDGSCLYLDCSGQCLPFEEYNICGCTDPLAINDIYNPEATFNDGSCAGNYPDNGNYVLEFDGVDDFIDISGNINIQDDFEINVKLNLKNLDNEQEIISK